MEAMLERFATRAPVAVMARLGLQRAIGAEWVEQVFAEHSGTQYTRELLFSTVVDLMSLVALGLRPSLHAAATKAGGLTVSLAALYDKVKRTEPALVRALVAGSATRLGPVTAPLRKGRGAPWLRGWRVRVVDGNHFAATDKRLAPLRGFRGGALPGQALVVYDPDAGLVRDLVPCEDGHGSEHDLLLTPLADAGPGELWIGDRLFSTRTAILAAHARGAAVLFRETGVHPSPTEAGPRRRIGRVETGVVYEQPVTLPTPDGGALAMRRIEVVLDTPTESGERVVRLITTLPAAVRARAVARLYRRRWTIEGLFGRLEAALHAEVSTLGYPRAALLAFGLAVVAYNVLEVIEAAVAAAHDLEAEGIEVSTYYVAEDVRSDYGGMCIAIAEDVWEAYEEQSPAALARTLRAIARNVDPHALRKHPRAPKPKVAKGYAPKRAVARHVSTARVLREGRIS
jgi:IS4 transposase